MHDGFRKSSFRKSKRTGTGNWEAAYALAQEAEAQCRTTRASRALAATLMARHDRVRAARGSGVSARVQRDGCGWQELGPRRDGDIRIPFGLSRVRLELDGYAPMSRTLGGGVLVGKNLLPDFTASFYRAGVLQARPKKESPETRYGCQASIRCRGASVQLRDDLLDRYEVTNVQSKAFVDEGGYHNRALGEVVRDGQIVPWDEAMTLSRTVPGGPDRAHGKPAIIRMRKIQYRYPV